jgi:putative SOS response-associated peptidase YedK
MCANYTPVTNHERLRRFFGVGLDGPLGAETWPGYAAAFVRQARPAGADGAPGREAALGLFGLVPHWAKDLTIGRRTYNARSETVDEKPSFRDAWRQGRRCIVPADDFFEPNWESGRAVRWRIRRRDGAPMGIAGLWGAWRGPDGRELQSFTMLTINADGHDVMRHFHKPDDEKRMVVILDESDYDAWLDAPRARLHDFLVRYPADALEAEPAPKPPAAKRRA